MTQPDHDPKAHAAIPLQDPHKLRQDKERNLEVAIGKEVRAFRQNQRITVKELSEQTGLSVGMLSKIENGVTSPSLTTLQLLANALSVPLCFGGLKRRAKRCTPKRVRASKLYVKAPGRGININCLAISDQTPVGCLPSRI